MKRIFVLILMIFMLVTNIFAIETVATTYQTNLKPSDMVEIFVEELNKDSYAYQVADYKVYTTQNEQNYAWSVKIDTEGYRNGNTKTLERSIYLYMKNGYVCLKTFGGPTITNHKHCIDANEEISKIHDALYDAIYSYTKESKKWLKRYDKNYREDELEALDILNNINTLYNYYHTGLSNTFRREYYIVEKSLSYIEDFVKSNNLDWSFCFLQDEELLDFCKRHNCSLYKKGDKDSKKPESIKKSKLKKLKKEGYNIYVYYTCPYTFYKIQYDEVVSSQACLQCYLSIDDMLLGDYQKISCRFVDASNNVLMECF
ncbi:MAG: hypothetical protein SOY54_07880 [Bacilli bacterium]|nr:hypothetical protein [Bacilli bacterium]